ncbi:hypothetical protein BH09PSE6_BH09PSE6_13360 [soil metagenome]
MALFNRSAREAPQPTRARNSQRADDAVAALRRRARQRFVGALLLVVTAVIVIPMLLDSDPRPLDPAIDVSIPSRDKPFEPALPPAVPGAGAPATPPAASSSTSAGEPERTVASVIAKAEPPKSEPAKTEPLKTEPPKTEPAKAEPAKAEPAKTEAPKVEAPKVEPSKTDAHPERKLDSAITTPKPAEPAANDDARKAQALLDGKSAAAAGKFYVQVGAFANVDGVKELQARLRKAGVETYTEKLKTAKGEHLRVRAGPYAGRPEAEQMLGKVKDVGVDGAAIVQ